MSQENTATTARAKAGVQESKADCPFSLYIFDNGTIINLETVDYIGVNNNEVSRVNHPYIVSMNGREALRITQGGYDELSKALITYHELKFARLQ